MVFLLLSMHKSQRDRWGQPQEAAALPQNGTTVAQLRAVHASAEIPVQHVRRQEAEARAAFVCAIYDSSSPRCTRAISLVQARVCGTERGKANVYGVS